MFGRSKFEQMLSGLLFRRHFIIVCKTVKQFLARKTPSEGWLMHGFRLMAAGQPDWGCYL
jgi:hypothetical protein